MRSYLVDGCRFDSLTRCQHDVHQHHSSYEGMDKTMPLGFTGGSGIAALMTSEGKGPTPGQLMRNRDLASTMRRLGEKGAKEGFYKGPIADAIVQAVTSRGGVLQHADLQNHATAVVEAISATYRYGHAMRVQPASAFGSYHVLSVGE